MDQNDTQLVCFFPFYQFMPTFGGAHLLCAKIISLFFSSSTSCPVLTLGRERRGVSCCSFWCFNLLSFYFCNPAMSLMSCTISFFTHLIPYPIPPRCCICHLHYRYFIIHGWMTVYFSFLTPLFTVRTYIEHHSWLTRSVMEEQT